MSEEQKEHLRRWAELKRQEKEIESELEMLSPLILENIPVDEKFVLADVGSFTVSAKTVWQFSPAVEALKAEEKATGVAKETKGKPFVAFKAIS